MAVPSASAASFAASPKVFLSYSWTSPEYGARILDLANRLQDAAVEVVIDRAHLTGGQDANAYMERMVTDATITHVLLLCDPRYADRADDRQGGVGTETFIVSPAVYTSATQTRFVPVVMEYRDDGTYPLPTYLGTRYAYDLADPQKEDQEFENLVKHLYGKPAVTLRPLGTRPAYVDGDGVVSITGRTAAAAIVALASHRPQRAALVEAYGDKLVEAFAAERVPTGIASADELRQLHEASIAHFLPYRDEFVTVVQAIGRAGDDPEVYDRLHATLERMLGVWRDQDANPYNADYGTANLSLLARELVMYAVVVLLSGRRFTGLRRIVSRYFVPSTMGHAGGVETIAAFDGSSEMFDGRGSSGSIFGRMLRDRATLPSIGTPQLREAEFVCGVRARFDAQDVDVDVDWLGSHLWWPKVTERWGFSPQDLPLVARLRDPDYRRRFLAVFEIASDDELRTRLNSLSPYKPENQTIGWLSATSLARWFGLVKDGSL